MSKFGSLSEKFKTLESLGFTTPDYKVLDKSEIESHMRSLSEVKESLDVAIDGLVICVDDLKSQEKMGWESSRLKPRYSIALKDFFGNDKEFVTTVESLMVSMEGSSRIGLGVHLKPVQDVDGAMIKACIIKTEWLDSGALRPGTLVAVKRGSLIIPRITKILHVPTDVEPLRVPDCCPVCGAKIVREGQYYVCPNDSCRAKEISRMDHFFKVAEVKHFGRGLAEKLLDMGVTLKDFFEDDWRLLIESKIGSFSSSKTWQRFADGVANSRK